MSVLQKGAVGDFRAYRYNFDRQDVNICFFGNFSGREHPKRPMKGPTDAGRRRIPLENNHVCGAPYMYRMPTVSIRSNSAHMLETAEVKQIGTAKRASRQQSGSQETAKWIASAVPVLGLNRV